MQNKEYIKYEREYEYCEDCDTWQDEKCEGCDDGSCDGYGCSEDSITRWTNKEDNPSQNNPYYKKPNNDK